MCPLPETAVESERITVLLAGVPGRVQDGLRALLSSLPRLQVVGVASTVSETLDVAAALKPALLVVDADLGGHAAPPFLRLLRAASPDARLLVLADTAQQQAELAEVGIGGVLLKGAGGAELLAMAESLISQPVSSGRRAAPAWRGAPASSSVSRLPDPPTEDPEGGVQ
jgi:DNA-binding NarL/FixJ family response regulator